MSIKELIQEEVAEILEAAKNPLSFQLVVEALEMRQITVRTMNPRKFSEHYFQVRGFPGTMDT